MTQKPLGRGGRVATEIVCRLWNRPYETVRLPGSVAMVLVVLLRSESCVVGVPKVKGTLRQFDKAWGVVDNSGTFQWLPLRGKIIIWVYLVYYMLYITQKNEGFFVLYSSITI